MSITEEEMARDFQLSYQGTPFEDGRIAVGDLAPALIALADLFHEANSVADPLAPPVRLEIQAFHRSAFDVSLHLATQNLVTFLQQDAVVSAALLLGFVIDAKDGVLAAVKWLGGRPWHRDNDSHGRTIIRTEDGDELDVPSDVAVLLERRTVKRWVRLIVKPLREDGAEALVVSRDNDAEPLRLTPEDLPAFEAYGDQGTEELPDQEIELALTVSTVALNPDHKWRLSDDNVRTFPAAISDSEFWDRVNRREEVFGAGDWMLAQMRIRQRRDAENRIHTEREVVRVVEYHQGAGPTSNARLFEPDD